MIERYTIRVDLETSETELALVVSSTITMKEEIMNQAAKVLNALYMDGLSTTHRKELFSETNGEIHLDFYKIVKIPAGVSGTYAATELQQTYWGTSHHPVTVDLVTANLVTFTTDKGHGVPVIEKISEMYSDTTVYHAYFYTDTRQGCVVQWCNGKVCSMDLIDSDINSERQLADLILNEYTVCTNETVNTYYHQYDIVRVNCCVQAYGNIANTRNSIRSRELFRTGNIGVITHVNYDADGVPISYIVHNTATGYAATLLPTEMSLIDFGNIVDDRRIPVRQTGMKDTDKEE